MADITQLKVDGTTYDIKDNTKLPKTTYEWNKEFAAGQNGAISLGRYNIYDSQLTFDITSTTSKSLSGKLVIATQNGSLLQAKVFGDASGTLVSKLIIYQSAISNNRSWIEIFCNFDGWSKNKVHIYAVALNSATVEKQMTSVTISNGVPATANVTSGDAKWTGTILNDSDHSHDVSIATSSGTNELTLAHGTKYALTAGGQSFIFTMPSSGDSNTWRKIQLNGTDKLGTATSTNPLNFKAGSNMIILESNGTFTFAATDTWRGIQDNLNSTSTTESLSANQGKFLKAAIDGKAAYNHGHGKMDGSGCLSTASVVVITDTNKKISPSSITATELGYLDGVTSNIQTQLNSKAASNHTHTTNSTFYLDDRNYVHATGFYAQSDKRLKENIKEFIPQKSILDLPVVEFDYIETKSHNIGCLAQDLQEICPEIVNETEEGYLSIEEDKLVYLLLLEVKKLKAETEILKNKLEKQSN